MENLELKNMLTKENNSIQKTQLTDKHRER